MAEYTVDNFCDALRAITKWNVSSDLDGRRPVLEKMGFRKDAFVDILNREFGVDKQKANDFFEEKFENRDKKDDDFLDFVPIWEIDEGRTRIYDVQEAKEGMLNKLANELKDFFAEPKTKA